MCRVLLVCAAWTVVVGVLTLSIPIGLNRLDAAINPTAHGEADIAQSFSDGMLESEYPAKLVDSTFEPSGAMEASQ